MKDRNGRTLQTGDHVAYYRLRDGMLSGHVGTVVKLDEMRGRAVVRLDPGTRDASLRKDFRSDHPALCLEVDRPAVADVAAVQPVRVPVTRKHMMGLDPETVDWAAHHVFCASL